MYHRHALKIPKELDILRYLWGGGGGIFRVGVLGFSFGLKVVYGTSHCHYAECKLIKVIRKNMKI